MAGFRVGIVGTAALIATLALAAAALVSAAPASAALSYVESGNESTTAGNLGFNSVGCPLSSFAVGGGVFSTGGFGAVGIIVSDPRDAGWGEYTAVYSGTQNHRAFAICDTTQPTKRLETKTIKAGSEKTVRAACPSSQHVYGGGFFASGVFGDTVTRSSRPYDGPDADKVRGDGWEATSFSSSGDHPITVYALCGPKKTTVRTKTVDVDPTSQGFVQKKCGSDGRVTGGGADVAVGNGKGWISTIYPVDTGSDGTPDDAWAAYLENTSSKKRKITVYAVCR